MSWNHRVCKKTYKGDYNTVGSSGNKDHWSNVVYGIHEVYYNENGDIWGITDEPITVMSDKFEHDMSENDCVGELRLSLEWMLKALDKPVIDLDTHVYIKADFDVDGMDKMDVDVE